MLRTGYGTEVKTVNFGSHTSWVEVPIYHVLAVLHWTGDLTSLSLFPYLYDGNINGLILMRSLEGLNEVLCIKHLAHPKCPMMVMVVVVSLMINIRLKYCRREK